MTTTNAALTISRDSGDKFYVELYDLSSNQKITATLTPHEFAMAISGMARVPCALELPEDPSRLGKKRLLKRVEAPVSSYGDKAAAIVELQKQVPEGWELNEYLGSRDSFFQRDGQWFARSSMVRWVDVDDVSESK